MQRSASDVAWFTDAVLKFLDIQFYEPYSRVVDLSEGIQFPKWCLDVKMNIVHNCVDKVQSTDIGNQLSVVGWGKRSDEIFN
ncbi:MAG: acetyl-coenzyme A synthetase N-terminal domain-containing protein [Anaerolineales bacterium]|nr:acetyl-coenzyme A synthetase N-terminal domain-containing protein [Anaerolineales bacterium]